MKTDNEFSENYLNKGLSFPKREPGENISNTFNGPILRYWLDTGQVTEQELSEEQKYYAGVNQQSK